MKIYLYFGGRLIFRSPYLPKFTVIGKKIREIHFGHRPLSYILCAYKYIQLSLMNNFNPFLIYGNTG